MITYVYIVVIYSSGFVVIDNGWIYNDKMLNTGYTTVTRRG